ncbi:MAG: ATP-binding protein [Phycisphaerae bacterium]
MSADLFRSMKAYVGFAEEDARTLADLKHLLRPCFRGIVTKFYEAVARDPCARTILQARPGRREGLEQTLWVWLNELFSGRYGEAYFENRCTIGRMHVQVELPQHYMFTAMNVIRLMLEERILALDPQTAPRRLAALHKILDLELAIMNETYREDLIRHMKIAEHTEYEAKLSASEHLAAVGQLAASLAHEIKNPLAGISGAIQILGAGLAGDHPHKEIITEVLNQIDRLDAAVKDVLVYARPKPPDPARVNLGRALERALLLFRAQPAFRGVNVTCEDLSGEYIVEVDETQIQQVFANLILNAAHACESGGRIFCRIGREDGRVRVTIEDDGIGIPEEILPRVFEPFFTTKAKGTGLGLPICRRIIEAHHGTLELQSEAGGGTRVTVLLPGQI